MASNKRRRYTPDQISLIFSNNSTPHHILTDCPTLAASHDRRQAERNAWRGQESYDRDRLPQIDWVDMQKDLDDFESPYFDWENDRMFDESTQRLIDQIANDPRFHHSLADVEIVNELAPNKGEDEQQRLLQAAEEVFELAVLPGLEARASELVARALADPDFEALPVRHGESPADSAESAGAYTDPDPRVIDEFTRQLATSDAYQRRCEGALERTESEARQILSQLPRRTRDLLVLTNRNADRESLLEPWTERVSRRRRGWIAYYAQRIVREDDEDSVFDRYSAAAKILSGQSLSRKAIADALGMGVGRIDRLLERKGGQDITDNDPLCVLAPALRGHGGDWRHEGLVRENKPRPFSRLLAAEKLTLADESSEAVLLERLAKQGSRQISEALIARHCRDGDVGDRVLQTILFTRPSPWMRQEMIEAHHLRPLPKGTALALAEDDALVLLDCDEETVQAARSLNRDDFNAVLAVRQSDLQTLVGILTTGPESESLRQLVALFIERPLPDEILNSSRFLTALLDAAKQTDELELATTLRLVSCQSPEILSQHIAAARAGGSAAMSPEAIVAVALGPYHLSGSSARKGVNAGARALWEAVDLTKEHSIARAAVAERGTEVVSLETAGSIYVATADAISSFRKSDTTEYTYVHLRLTSAAKVDFSDFAIEMLNGTPALGYHREMRRHPLNTDGPEVEAIVWPIPLQPAIYSIETGPTIGKSAGLIAVSEGKVAIVKRK